MVDRADESVSKDIKLHISFNEQYNKYKIHIQI